MRALLDQLRRAGVARLVPVLAGFWSAWAVLLVAAAVAEAKCR